MGKIVDYIDQNAIAYGNLLTKGYNWTFGGTKLDLANEMLTIAPLFESVGFLNADPTSGAFFTAVYLFISHIQKITNKRMYKLEKDALEKGLLNLDIVKNKNFDIGLGIFWNIAGLTHTLPNHSKGYFINNRHQTELAVAGGHILRGSSFLVMLADDLPPRKNCLSRGLDKLLEFSDKYSPKTQIA